MGVGTINVTFDVKGSVEIRRFIAFSNGLEKIVQDFAEKHSVQIGKVEAVIYGSKKSAQAHLAANLESLQDREGRA